METMTKWKKRVWSDFQVGLEKCEPSAGLCIIIFIIIYYIVLYKNNNYITNIYYSVKPRTIFKLSQVWCFAPSAAPPAHTPYWYYCYRW